MPRTFVDDGLRMLATRLPDRNTSTKSVSGGALRSTPEIAIRLIFSISRSPEEGLLVASNSTWMPAGGRSVRNSVNDLSQVKQ
ncbi:hypothetical protein [Gemmatimonas sp.]|jgi:hypothetical protein|uniref:hypothetical protein n=1 Tax=Gemmatimonas sp. TaxID=1962908 RepID=UPI0037BF1BCB